jgi:hydroxyacylglutathione hydrolase
VIVEQIWTANNYRNFNYLIACPESGEAMADHKKCLAKAKAMGWDITQVLNTHEHGDHTGGNKAVIAATGATLLAHENAKDKIARATSSKSVRPSSWKLSTRPATP